jgi:cell division protease FtsH
MSTKLLLSGPPGTGKTTFARAMCNTLQIPLLATSVASWLEPGYLGDVLKRISATFDAAHQHGPAILFIDEIDGVGQRDGGGSRHYDDYWVTVVNRVLELPGWGHSVGGHHHCWSTNRPEAIDPALRRSGRLETHIAIQPPDLDALEGILAFHLGNELKHVLATSHGKPMQFAATQGEFP